VNALEKMIWIVFLVLVVSLSKGNEIFKDDQSLFYEGSAEVDTKPSTPGMLRRIHG